jgi:signal transduction histidine kinase
MSSRLQTGGAAGSLDWAAIVAHQIKTPLAAMDARLASPLGIDRRTLHEDIEKLARLIDGILVLARCRSAETGAVDLPLADLIPRVCADLAPLALGRSQTIAFRSFEPAASRRGDPDLAVEALANLVENALKYSPRGARVDVVLARSGSVLVMDRGPGLSAADRKLLYRPFARGSAGGGCKGNGLGLFIVAEILSRLDGRIDAMDRRGGGTVFRLDFAGGCPVPPSAGAP